MTATSGLSPPFQLRTDEDVPPEVLRNRAAFARGPLAKRTVESVALTELSLEEHAERLARSLVADFGPRWSEAVQLILRAGMRIEREMLDRRECEQVARDAAERDAKGETE
jgi:hypothetical protein